MMHKRKIDRLLLWEAAVHRYITGPINSILPTPVFSVDGKGQSEVHTSPLVILCRTDESYNPK